MVNWSEYFSEDVFLNTGYSFPCLSLVNVKYQDFYNVDRMAYFDGLMLTINNILEITCAETMINCVIFRCVFLMKVISRIVQFANINLNL